MFCAAHLHFGWAGAVAKLPLTVLALAAVLLLGTVWPAVVAHVLFNYRVWRSWREQPHFVAGAASARRISL
jgi:membrane protein YdbS with pleckstrin-like domain